jgi:hypothetical protein
VSDFILGVDLGQAQDYTALCVLEQTAVATGRIRTTRNQGTSVRGSHHDGRAFSYGGSRTITTPVTENHYAARHLERLPTGTPYPAQVKSIKELHDLLKLQEGKTPKMVVDQTGVGRPVVDMLRAVGLAPAAVSITGGDSVTQDGRDYRVPKRDLVSVVQVLLQAERLKIARALPEAQTLTSELLAFKVSISLSGHDSYGNDKGEWRENPHDDLVLAVALACWLGENPGPQGVPKRYSTGRTTARY